MDRGLIEEKLESLRRCIQRVASKRPDTVTELRDNWDLQDIIAPNLTWAVQLSVDIAAHITAEGNQPSPGTMPEASSSACHTILHPSRF
jgi:uncharacterized protein YutE (UPF0331/DUF86 family)